MLIFDFNASNSITDMFKPFVFLIAYTMGTGLSANYEDRSVQTKEIESIIYVCAFGAFAHYTLNLLTNFASIERDTIDFWTQSALSATAQASLASMCLGVAASLLFSDRTRKTKILAVVLVSVIVLYNLILAGRMLLLTMVIVFVIAFFYRRHNKKVGVGKDLLALLIFVAVPVIVYNLDLFGVKTIFETSNFYERFFGQNKHGIFDDPRLTYKLVYWEHLLDYPFGGSNIRQEYGFYAHELYLDTYDQYSVFAGVSIVCYIVSSLIRMVKSIRSSTMPFNTKQLILCVYVAMNLMFVIEPVMQGMPAYLVSYCLVDGSIARYLDQQKANAWGEHVE